MNVITWILSNWDIIVTVIVIIVGVIYAIKTGNVKIISSFLFALVTSAEKEFGGGTGELKKSAVMSWIYEQLPSFCKVIFTEAQLSGMIEQALASAKLKWEKNPALLDK